MVADLVRSVTYSNAEGELQSQPVRKYVAMVDGIVGGEGEGPLTPSPVNTGLLLLTDNPLLGDFAAATMMGYDPATLPIISRLFSLESHPLYSGDITEETVIHNGTAYPLTELSTLCDYHFAPSHGWEGHI
jgi:uncharacterized protein (DUF362 family)